MLDPAPHSTDSASAARRRSHWPGGSQQPAQTKAARRIVIAAAWSLLAALSLGAASANETAGSNPPLAPNESGFPDKAITLLVGANPGGGWDQLARLMQHILVTEDISPVPVEVVQFGWEVHDHFLESQGARPVIRRRTDGQPLTTDNGNYIIDCHFPDGIDDPESLDVALASRAGIVESGLFLGMATEVIVGAQDGVQHSYAKQESS